MNNTLLYNTIRICIKANKYSFGETLLFDIRSKRASIVVIANDAGSANKKKIIDKCNSNNVSYIELFNKAELYSLFSKNISSFGILDVNLAKKFKEKLNKGGYHYGE